MRVSNPLSKLRSHLHKVFPIICAKHGEERRCAAAGRFFIIRRTRHTGETYTVMMLALARRNVRNSHLDNGDDGTKTYGTTTTTTRDICSLIGRVRRVASLVPRRRCCRCVVANERRRRRRRCRYTYVSSLVAIHILKRIFLYSLVGPEKMKQFYIKSPVFEANGTDYIRSMCTLGVTHKTRRPIVSARRAHACDLPI